MAIPANLHHVVGHDRRRHPATMNIQRAIPRNHRLDEVPFEMGRCLPLANHIAQRVGANLALSGDIDQI